LTKKRKKIHLKYKSYVNEEERRSKTSKRLKIKEDVILIYDKNVSIEEILPLVIKKNRCKNMIPLMEISWTVIQEGLKTRSIDDIRNYWQLKLVPMMVPPIDERNLWA
jgi:hypothetical protein